MNTNIKNKIINLARNSEEEICGFLYYNDYGLFDIFPCENVAFNKTEEFEIDPKDFLNCEKIGKICGVYHSHPGDENSFSESDIEFIEELGVPLYMFCAGDNSWHEYIPPTYKIELEKLPFIWGLFDCYSIIRNYLRQEKNIFLPDFDRTEKFETMEVNEPDIISNIKGAGGVIICEQPNIDFTKLKIGDVLLFTTKIKEKNNPLHFGIFLGNSTFLHHPQNRISQKSYLNLGWLNRLSHVIRHNTL